MKILRKIFHIFARKNQQHFMVGDTVCLCNNKNIKGFLGKALTELLTDGRWKPAYVLNTSKIRFLTSIDNMKYFKLSKLILTEKVIKLKYFSKDIFQGKIPYKYVAKPGLFSPMFKRLIWTEDDINEQ